MGGEVDNRMLPSVIIICATLNYPEQQSAKTQCLVLLSVSENCYMLPSFLGKLTAEVWRESVSEGSEGRQTATEPIESAREPLGPPPLPSRMVALVKVTWSKLCDWWKE